MLAESGIEALFDVADDPAETRDLAADQPALGAALAEKINSFVSNVGKVKSRTAEVDAQIVEQLRALGYVE